MIKFFLYSFFISTIFTPCSYGMEHREDSQDLPETNRPALSSTHPNTSEHLRTTSLESPPVLPLLPIHIKPSHKRALSKDMPLDEKNKKRKTDGFSEISANLALYQLSLEKLGISINGFKEFEGEISAEKINTSVKTVGENFQALEDSFRVYFNEEE